jgi:prepilin-type N-terminal cleavage/methylation domain-containing protein
MGAEATILTTGRRNSAFTLIELLLVMLVVTVVLAVAAPSMRGFAAGRATADAATKAVALTKWARAQAIALGQPCRVNVSPDGGSFQLTVQNHGAFVPADGDAGLPINLPDGARAALQQPKPVAGTLRTDPTTANRSFVQFYPNARSDVATIEITGKDGDVFLVSCDSPTEAFRVFTPAEASNR